MLKRRAAEGDSEPTTAFITERRFLQRFRNVVDESAPPGLAQELATYKAKHWTDALEKERLFQQQKRQKRLVEANMQQLLNPGEVSCELEAATAMEQQRQLTSLKSRIASETSLANKLVASPPSEDELHGVSIFLDSDVSLPSDWHVAIASHEAFHCGIAHDHHIFITAHPWEPANILIAWSARLQGAWIMTPEVYSGKARGPVAKFEPALSVRRKLWVSPDFRNANPSIWLLILELLAKCRSRWTILATKQDWASEKARAIAQKRSAEVLALVTEAELHREARGVLPHVLGPQAFLDFIERANESRTILGLGLHL